MKLWLTKYIGERKYYLTLFKPLKRRVKGTKRNALYVEPGETIGVPYLCEEGIVSLFGSKILKLKDGESIKVNIQGEIINGSST